MGKPAILRSTLGLTFDEKFMDPKLSTEKHFVLPLVHPSYPQPGEHTLFRRIKNETERDFFFIGSGYGPHGISHP